MHPGRVAIGPWAIRDTHKLAGQAGKIDGCPECPSSAAWRRPWISKPSKCHYVTTNSPVALIAIAGSSDWGVLLSTRNSSSSATPEVE